jgi:plasmid maintenance system killer protein
LELSFHNKDIRLICEDEDQAKTTYGAEITGNLQKRLSDILAAKTWSELQGLPGKLTRVSDKPYSDYRLDIGEGHWIFITCGHPKPPIKDEDFDWQKIARIKVVKIEKMHG